MSIKEQMEVTDKLEGLEAESRKINDNTDSLAKEIENIIKKFKENICNEIKNKILEQGKTNNFEITEKGNNWSMKYKNLEYIGNFTSPVKYVERINGTARSKVEFILELEKHRPNRDISLTGHYKSVIEQMEERITKEKAILDKYQKFQETLKETDIIVKYQIGEQHIIKASLPTPEDKRNYMTVKIDELVKIVIG